MFSLAVFSILLVGLAAAKLAASYFNRPTGTRWLPGPKGIPFIGRVWDIPRTHSYKQFKKWSDKFGNIYQINIFGVNHVWIASDRIANDLLVKRSQIFSDRPPINNLEDSKGAPEYLPLLGYNDVWRRQRRFAHGMMSASSAHRHHDLPYLEGKQFLVELLQTPQDLELHCDTFTGRVVSRLAYGDAKFASEMIKHSHALLSAISPAANLTNIIPQLRLLPAWLSPWKRAERARHDRERAFFIQLREHVAASVAAGDSTPSYMRRVLENQEKSGMDDVEGAYLIGMVGLAGMLTTASVLMIYVLAMCLYPEWQTKVQEEIDRVCGDRMPKPSDAPDLPVLRAVIKECMRWRPVIPNSIPHESQMDFIYEGYFIPKGTHVHPSQWAITRDESVYPDPERFNPERWLLPSYPSYQEPLTKFPNIQNYATFGYGRRICMGMDLVEQELIVGMGGMAWAFDIAKKRDPLTGRPIHVPAHENTSLLISRPRPFQFTLKARSREREAGIWREYEEAVNSGQIAGIQRDL